MSSLPTVASLPLQGTARCRYGSQGACQRHSTGAEVALLCSQPGFSPGSPGIANALSDVPIPAGHDVAFAVCGQRSRPGTERRALGPERLHAPAQALGRLRSLCPGRPDPPSSGVRHRHRDRGRKRSAGHRRSGPSHPIRDAPAFQEGYRRQPAPRTPGCTDVGPFRHVIARNGAYHAGRPRRLHHRLA